MPGLALADPADALAIANLHNAVAEDLTATFGPGPWSSPTSEAGVAFSMKTGRVLVARERGRIMATLRLATRKPWAIDKSYFTPVRRPLYLTDMAVIPGRQRRGIGRAVMEDAMRIARDWPAEAIRLDAWDAEAGAGGFYAKCGFIERGHVTYRRNPLIYYERLVTP
jgi:GNAT superfamily N-acetyltransferase